MFGFVFECSGLNLLSPTCYNPLVSYHIIGFKIKMTPEKKSSVKNEVNKAKSKVAKNLFQVGLATSMLFGAPACVPTEAISIIPTGETNPLPDDATKIPESPTEANYELTPTVKNPATEELTLTPEPTATATEMPTGLIKIDMDNVIYPPVGYVKEYFEKGEYDAGLETIKQWVGVWEKMGVFEGLEIENNSLSPVPLDGRARIVCVRADEEAPLLCPPLDLINGGLKAVPEEGNWDETDMPLMVSLERLEELISRGSETDMAYQFIDKYQKYSIKYIDPKTGQMVEGSYIPPLEVKKNEPIEGSVVCFADEFCMGGQMKIDQEMAVKYYDRFINALVNNMENREYFDVLLSGNISQESLKKYLVESGGIVPPGLKLMRDSGGGYFTMSYVLDREIKLNALKMITFGPTEWKNNVGNIQEYISSVDNVGLADPFVGDLGVSLVFLGWYIDSSSNIVLVSGSKDFESNYNDGRVEDPFPVIGGKDGKYIPERDNMIATATFLSWACLFENSQKSRPFFVVPLMDIPGQPVVLDQDVVNFSGNRTLFVK